MPSDFDDRGMRLLADHYLNGRRAEESLGLDIPSGPREHGVPGRGQGGEIGDGSSGDERSATFGRQGQRIQQPSQRNFFEGGGDRRGRKEARVLIPRRRQPVSAERGGQRTTDYEPEKPRTGDAHGGRRACFVQHADDVLRSGRSFRKRFVKLRKFTNRFGGGTDTAFLDILEISRGAQRDGVQEFPH